MLHDRLEVYTLSIVFVGDFNPVIIQPFWLALKGLIREGEAKTAKVDLIHNDVVKFDLDWVAITVTKQRFELRTSKEPYFEATKDLGIGIFEILKETPITALGINHIKNFKLKDAETYQEFGNQLSPLKNWNNFLNDPRVLEVEIVVQSRPDKHNGNYRIKVTPSDTSLAIQYGVAFNVNDHFIITAGTTGRNNEMVKMLATEWKNSLQNCANYIEAFWKNINLSE